MANNRNNSNQTIRSRPKLTGQAENGVRWSAGFLASSASSAFATVYTCVPWLDAFVISMPASVLFHQHRVTVPKVADSQ